MDYLPFIFSSIAILISIFTFYEARNNNRINNRPALLGNESESELSYRFQVINKGSGQAQFEKVEFLYRGEPLKPKDYKLKLKEELNSIDLRYKLSVTTPGQNSVMAPGESLDLVFFEVHSEDKHKIDSLEEGIFDVTIYYRSSHGEKFTWSS